MCVGTPQTSFAVHLRVLITGADHSYRLTGPRCPRLTSSGGSAGGTRDLRGRIWSDQIKPGMTNRLRPGSYRISVTIMDLGSNGRLTHPAKPFGSAGFTVR